MIHKQVEDEKINVFLHCTRFPTDEQDIIKATKGGVFSRVECLGIAAVLNINAKALRAALEYFDDLNIFCTICLFFQQ